MCNWRENGVEIQSLSDLPKINGTSKNNGAIRHPSGRSTMTEPQPPQPPPEEPIPATGHRTGVGARHTAPATAAGARCPSPHPKGDRMTTAAEQDRVTPGAATPSL